jgi:hypothetical protein
MSEQTPSQAEGDRDDEYGLLQRRGRESARHAEPPETPRTTPSQAEGEREENRE